VTRYAGDKNPARRVYAHMDSDFREYRKTQTILATRISEPFEVETLEGLHTGKAGDWLAVGAHGECYPIDADVFADTYEEVPS
jgi:hypothetical protein